AEAEEFEHLQADHLVLITDKKPDILLFVDTSLSSTNNSKYRDDKLGDNMKRASSLMLAGRIEAEALSSKNLETPTTLLAKRLPAVGTTDVLTSNISNRGCSIEPTEYPKTTIQVDSSGNGKSRTNEEIPGITVSDNFSFTRPEFFTLMIRDGCRIQNFNDVGVNESAFIGLNSQAHLDKSSCVRPNEDKLSSNGVEFFSSIRQATSDDLRGTSAFLESQGTPNAQILPSCALAVSDPLNHPQLVSSMHAVESLGVEKSESNSPSVHVEMIRKSLEPLPITSEHGVAATPSSSQLKLDGNLTEDSEDDLLRNELSSIIKSPNMADILSETGPRRKVSFHRGADSASNDLINGYNNIVDSLSNGPVHGTSSNSEAKQDESLIRHSPSLKPQTEAVKSIKEAQITDILQSGVASFETAVTLPKNVLFENSSPGSGNKVPVVSQFQEEKMLNEDNIWTVKRSQLVCENWLTSDPFPSGNSGIEVPKEQQDRSPLLESISTCIEDVTLASPGGLAEEFVNATTKSDSSPMIRTQDEACLVVQRPVFTTMSSTFVETQTSNDDVNCTVPDQNKSFKPERVPRDRSPMNLLESGSGESKLTTDEVVDQKHGDIRSNLPWHSETVQIKELVSDGSLSSSVGVRQKTSVDHFPQGVTCHPNYPPRDLAIDNFSPEMRSLSSAYKRLNKDLREDLCAVEEITGTKSVLTERLKIKSGASSQKTCIADEITRETSASFPTFEGASSKVESLTVPESPKIIPHVSKAVENTALSQTTIDNEMPPVVQFERIQKDSFEQRSASLKEMENIVNSRPADEDMQTSAVFQKVQGLVDKMELVCEQAKSFKGDVSETPQMATGADEIKAKDFDTKNEEFRRIGSSFGSSRRFSLPVGPLENVTLTERSPSSRLLDFPMHAFGPGVGDLSPIVEETSPLVRRLTRPLNLSVASPVLPPAATLHSEVSHPRLSSRLLEELDTEATWLLALKERLTNGGSIELDDTENQKLLDYYYEINRELMSRKQVSLAICDKAEQMANQDSSKLPVDTRTLLEVKAAEIRAQVEQLTRETDATIRLLTASIDSLEQLTFRLQDSKSWLSSVELSFIEAMNTGNLAPDGLSVIQAQITQIEHDLLSREDDLKGVSLGAQRFLFCLHKYNNSKTVNAGVTDDKRQALLDSAESVESSVQTAVAWTLDKYSELEASLRKQSSILSGAVLGYSEFANGLGVCRDSLDTVEKKLWQAVRKLLAVGVDVNPNSQGTARTPINLEMITNPASVVEHATSLFALEGDLSSINFKVGVLDEIVTDLSANKLPPLSIPESVIDITIKQPLEAEKTRLANLFENVRSIKEELKAVLGCIGTEHDSLADVSSWLQSVLSTENKGQSLIEARQASNQLQAELSARKLGLESSLESAQKELGKLEENGGENEEEIERVKDRIAMAQKLVDKCNDVRSKVTRDQAVLDEIQQNNSLLDKSSRDLRVFLDSVRPDLSAITNARISDEEANQRLKEIEEGASAKRTEIEQLRENINGLQSSASEIARESDIIAAKQRLDEASADLAEFDQSMNQARHALKERSLLTRQFEATRAQFTDWMQEFESRMDSSVLANHSAEAEESLLEQLKELDSMIAEWDAFKTQVKEMQALRESLEPMAVTNSMKELEGLNLRFDQIGERLSAMRSDVNTTQECLESFCKKFSTIDTWLTHRLDLASKCQITSADMQEIQVWKDKLDILGGELVNMTPQIDDLRQRGNELLQLKSAAKVSSQIRRHLGDLDQKWHSLTELHKSKDAELADILAQTRAINQRYDALDDQLGQHLKTFESLSGTPVSKTQLQKVLSLQFGIIRMEPMVRAFEQATERLVQSLLPHANTSDLSTRVNEIRSRYDCLKDAIDSRLETLQNTMSSERLNDFSNRLDLIQEKLKCLDRHDDLSELEQELLETTRVGNEIASRLEDPVEKAAFSQKLQGLTENVAKIKERVASAEPVANNKSMTEENSTVDEAPIVEPKTQPNEIDSLKKRLSSVQPTVCLKATELEMQSHERRESLQNLEISVGNVRAWLDLETNATEVRIFESGSYPVTRPSLSKAIQGVETLIALTDSRSKQLEELFSEANKLQCSDLLSDIEKCQTQLSQVKQLYDKKCDVLQEILSKSDQLDMILQPQSLTLDNLESRLSKALGSSVQLESLQREIAHYEFPSIDSQLLELEGTLSKLGDAEPTQSTRPLRQHELELRRRLERLISSLRRAIEESGVNQEASLNLLARGDLIKHRLDELEGQIGLTGSVGTALDPETLIDRLEDVKQGIQKLEQCDAALKSLEEDREDLQLPQLESLLNELQNQSSRLRRTAQQVISEIEPTIDVSKRFAAQQELLTNNIAAARKASPVRPNRAAPTMEELNDYERQYLKPLANQLQKVQQTGATLCQMVQSGIGRRNLERELTSAAASVDSLYVVAGNAEQQIDVGLALSGKLADSTRRIEHLLKHVRDEFEAQGEQAPPADVVQLNAQLGKCTMLLHMLAARQGSLEYLAEVAENQQGHQSTGETAAKLTEDYNNVCLEVKSRIAKLTDALQSLKEFRNLYESYLGWLTTAECRFDRLPVDQDPSVTYENRITELEKLVAECTDQADTVRQLQTRGNELKRTCSAADAMAIEGKVAHVDSSFSEFRKKVESSFNGLQSMQPEIAVLLASNTILAEGLPKLESKLSDAQKTEDFCRELEYEIKPHADALADALEKIKSTIPSSIFLDLPSQRQPLTIGDFANENLQRFTNLYNETLSLSQQTQVLDKRIEQAYSKLREDEEWLKHVSHRLDSKASTQPAEEILNLREEFDQEKATYSLVMLPARVEQIDFLISKLNEFRCEYMKRQPTLEAHFVEARSLLASLDQSTHHKTGENSVQALAKLVQQVMQQTNEIDSLFDSAESRSQQALALSKSLSDGMSRMDSWMTSAEKMLDQLSVTPLVIEDESESLRRLYNAAKALERELDGYKVTLEQVSSTAATLSTLIAPKEAANLGSQLQQSSDRFRRLAKRIRNRSIDLEDAVTSLIDVNDRLSLLAEALNEARDLASTIGVRFDPLENELLTASIPSCMDSTSSTSCVRVQQPISLRSEYLSGQIAEGKAILEIMDRRLPALKSLTQSIEESTFATTPELSSTLQRDPLVLPAAEGTPGEVNADVNTLRGLILQKAQTLQKDWLQMHTKVFQRLTNLVEAHRLASEEFWLPLSNIQGDLITARRSIDSLVSGGASIQPLEASTYEAQLKEIERVVSQLQTADQRLNELRNVGDRIIDLLIDEEGRNEEERSILKNEVNAALREVSVISEDVASACKRQKLISAANLTTAQNLKADLTNFMNWIAKTEGEFEALEPVANETEHVLRQIEQTETWSDSVLPNHEQLENLNWVAGQLISAAGLPSDSADQVTNASPSGRTLTLQEMLSSASSRWENLVDALNHRRHQLQTELMTLGKFDSALQALLQWIKATQITIDAISVPRGDNKSLEFELSRARIIQTSAAKRQADVVRINQEVTGMEEPRDLDPELSKKLVQLNDAWDHLKLSVREKQMRLEEALREAQKFYSQLDELRRDCRRLEGQMPTSGMRVIGGLPDSAKQSINKFIRLHSSIDALGKQIGNLWSSSAGLLASAGSTHDRLAGHLENLSEHQSRLATQARDRLAHMESAVARVEAFHNELGDFIQWLTQAERRMNQAPAISFIPSTLELQLPSQLALRKEIAAKRDSVLAPLDRASIFIGAHSLEHDVVLVKNLLASAHIRWEKLFQRSADRSRQFASAFKESQKLMSKWKDLTEWLNEALNTHLQEGSWLVSAQTDILLKALSQHREFQRELGVHSATFDSVRRELTKLKDKAPRDDHLELDRMQSELKYLWNEVCAKSLEKQKALEEALLRSGQYKDALGSLLEWINKVDSLLDDDKKGCAGDVETVKHLEEAHQSLLAQLEDRGVSVAKLQTAAAQLLNKCKPETGSDAVDLTDSLVMQEQLAGLNALWTRVQLKAKARTERLKEARKNAEDFQRSCQDVMDYCAGAEYALRKLGALPEGDDPREMDATEPLSEETSANTAVAEITSGMAAQESRVCDCLGRGNRILAECKHQPEAAARIRQWMNAVNTRWEEVLDWSQKHEARLAQLAINQRERRLTLDALISWLNTAEVLLRSDRLTLLHTTSAGLSSNEAPSEISSESSSRVESGSTGFDVDATLVERLLAENSQFEMEIEARRPQRDEILKHSRKAGVTKKLTISRPRDVRSRSSSMVAPPAAKVYASERVNEMCEKWDRVVKLTQARRLILEERLAHANEVEKLKSFDFGSWRRRYLAWMNSKKARLIDMFHRYDLDRDGRLTREEFVNALLDSKFPTSRLELEVVASIVDANGEGFIDMKKFNAALRSTSISSNHPIDLSNIEGSAIEHEAKHQASLCTCHNTYRISKVNGNMYKFGDSQKLRLVRILRSNVMVRVGGGWTPLTEFLVKNDPCRAAFWMGNEIDRIDAGFPDDQTHMMLRFHPRFHDGSSSTASCSDPACSGQLCSSGSTTPARKRSIMRLVSQSVSGPLRSASQMPLIDKQPAREGASKRPERLSLPFCGLSNRKQTSSPSLSSHSISLAQQLSRGKSLSSCHTDAINVMKASTIPQKLSASSISVPVEANDDQSTSMDLSLSEETTFAERIPHHDLEKPESKSQSEVSLAPEITPTYKVDEPIFSLEEKSPTVSQRATFTEAEATSPAGTKSPLAMISNVNQNSSMETLEVASILPPFEPTSNS
uniref:KASH domain-containing protein n=1 Tax=Mesocestoides corti TaxID=53468 RepID=A0A5K3FG96_MESCO